jgi:hypothetical protein
MGFCKVAYYLNSLIPVSANLVKNRRIFFSSEWPGNVGGVYKVAYWLKSGPFLAENLSRPIQPPNVGGWSPDMPLYKYQDHFLRRIYPGRSGDQPPTFTGI